MQKKIVDVVGKDELLDLDAFFAKASREVYGLREIDVAVVVAVNKQDGRLPGTHRCDGRGIVGQFRELGRDIFSVPVVGGPIVDAVKIDAGGEEVGVASQAERGEIATITSAS